jgi:hypothetical protein
MPAQYRFYRDGSDDDDDDICESEREDKSVTLCNSTVIADGKVVRFRNGSSMNRYLCCIRAWVGVQLHFCSHSFGP